MYDIELPGADNRYEFEELIKVFLPASEFSVLPVPGPRRDKKAAMRELYRELAEKTGKRPEWGTLTGVRPVKLTCELYERLNDRGKVIRFLLDEYIVSPEKAELIVSIYEYQREILPKRPEERAGLYVSIPFCPTRCLYCSFTSNQVSQAAIEGYMGALLREIEFTGAAMRAQKVKPETIYIGGGTPTELTPVLLEGLLEKIGESYDFSELAEYTVEAGRADTITGEKLKIIRGAGVGRISINPQTMNEKTLKLIGRRHSAGDVTAAYAAARRENFETINMDIIAGLPEETTEDFMATVDRVVGLAPENITVHTLAVKRASVLKEQDRNYHYRHGDVVREMLSRAGETLRDAGYRPYYLYRQKNMAGNLENTGWCKGPKAGLYNMRMMEERQTVVAVGAGGISKAYYPSENRLERVPNVSNYEQYISRIDEMIDRKKEKLFSRRETNASERT